MNKTKKRRQFLKWFDSNSNAYFHCIFINRVEITNRQSFFSFFQKFLSHSSLPLFIEEDLDKYLLLLEWLTNSDQLIPDF